MDSVQERPVIWLIGGIVLGFILGLVWGWVIDPVEWTDAGPAQLASADQEAYVRTVAELYSFDGDTQKVRDALSGWNGDVAACQAAANTADPADRARLEAVATIVNDQGCGGVAEGDTAVADEGGSTLGPVFFLGLLLIFLVAGIFFVMNRRQTMLAETGQPTTSIPPAPMPDSPIAYDETADVDTAAEEVATTPLAQFNTSYTYGNDIFDDSFSIENMQGDFLGECGVGISESIGTGDPKNVTAFEIWLFDKNDIRTVTKVLMSDHAFFDEALKAKMAPKGEPILARENETIVLETNTLIINATVKEMTYGTGTLPPQSYFEGLTVELSAWSKEGSDVLEY